MSGISKIAVLGSGLMGRGIGQVAASSGLQVTLYDVRKEFLSKGMEGITASLSRISAKKFGSDANAIKSDVSKIASRISLTTDVETAVKDADLVVEAIIENIPIKQEMFQRIDSMAPAKCIFASNTSSLSVTEIASQVSSARQAQFAGLHFFNPVPMMKLVEIVATDQTSKETVGRLKDLSKELGKTSVLCKDTPGFIVNRLLVPYLIEAVRMWERGDASISDIDTAMKLGASYPMGPFELLDYVGLDTVKYILDAWHKAHPEIEAFRPCESLNQLVQKNYLGRKTGKGFLEYPPKK